MSRFLIILVALTFASCGRNAYLQKEGRGLVTLNPATPGEGPLKFGYLKAGNVNFGSTEKGSSYSKLLYVKAIKGKRVQILNLKSSSQNNSILEFSTVQQNCSSVIDSDCFLEVNLTPNQVGSFRENLFIDYKIEGSNKEYSVPVGVLYSVVDASTCFAYYEESHQALRGSDLDEQLDIMEFPYYFSSPDTSVTLTKLGNTDSNAVATQNGVEKHYNRNTQVGISFAVTKETEVVYDTRVLLNIEKYLFSEEPNQNTELFCSSEFLKCSGTKFYAADHVPLINSDFTLVNSDFSDELMAEGVSSTNIVDILSLNKGFGLSDYLNITESDLNNWLDTNSTLSFVLADDMRIMDLPLLITSRKLEKTCE